MIKEAWEEAGIPSDLMSKSVCTGMVSYYHSSPERGNIPDYEYVFDLAVGADFTPVPTDGEVFRFFLLDSSQVVLL